MSISRLEEYTTLVPDMNKAYAEARMADLRWAQAGRSPLPSGRTR